MADQGWLALEGVPFWTVLFVRLLFWAVLFWLRRLTGPG